MWPWIYITCIVLVGLVSSKTINRPGSQDSKKITFNTTAQVGTTVFLPCKVHSLGTRSVSWMRDKDQRILSVDEMEFVQDPRFRAFYTPNTATWTLEIKNIRESDGGIYECQESSKPKKSHFIQLNVLVPEVRIIGGPEIYVRGRSKIILRCSIAPAIDEPTLIEWFHETKQFTETGASRVKIQREKFQNNTAVSILEISGANAGDTGRYSCNPFNLAPAEVTVHVVEGEYSAAMQERNNAPTSFECSAKLWIIVAYTLWQISR